MNFIHYLYIKGETIFEFRLGGRGLIVAPIWTVTTVFSFYILPVGIEKFNFFLIFFCWLGVLIGLTYLIIPKKKVQKKLKSWMRKYNKVPNYWAWLYLLSPIIIMLMYLIIT